MHEKRECFNLIDERNRARPGHQQPQASQPMRYIAKELIQINHDWLILHHSCRVVSVLAQNGRGCITQVGASYRQPVSPLITGRHFECLEMCYKTAVSSLSIYPIERQEG